MNPAEAQRLREVYRREYRSLLQYTREAAPYASVADRPLRDGVLRIAEEESASLESFGLMLEENRITLPYLGSFPMPFTDLNFAAIRHFLPKLRTEQKQDLAKLEADESSLASPEARAAVQKLVDIHRRHLKELESLS